MRGKPHDRRHRWRPETNGSGSVNLISMMDILTVLLLFLLKSYVAGGEVMVPAPGIHLPASTADQPPPTSVVVAIERGEIMVGGEHAASMSEALGGDGMEIAPLSARLQAIQAQQDEIARMRGAKPEASRTVTIQGDRDIEFKVLQKVMYTLGQNGYENISLAVLQKS
jgi:biopolymer transport protein ExbD